MMPITGISAELLKSASENREKWDRRFLDMAQLVASWSKDPNTRVGAVLVRPDKTIASTGYNGYPKKMRDIGMENRDEKLSRVIHAEMNAIHFCKDQSLEGYTLYVWPMMPCDRCAVHIIQAGVTRVVSTDYNGEGRWSESILKSLGYLHNCDVAAQIYPLKDQQSEQATQQPAVSLPPGECPLHKNQ